jgi:hypothetical protein
MKKEPEYIIKGHILEVLITKDLSGIERVVIGNKVRSRSYHPAPTDCPHHRSVFYDGNDKTKPMEHHCDFLTETCEIEENKIRQSEWENVLDEVKTKLSKLKTGSHSGADFVWWLVIETALNELKSLRREVEKQ